MQRLSRAAVVALLLSHLGACVSAENEAKVREARLAAGVREGPTYMSAEAARAFFVDRTRVTSAGHLGSQISYMAPDGTAYLWFPGNAVILRGRWTMRNTGGYAAYAGRPVARMSVCFDYGPGSVNAFDGGAGERCIPADPLARLTRERADGDVFGLQQRREAPFVLPPKATTIAEVRARLGRP